MTTRRNLLVGGACIAAAGSAALLQRRREVTLLKGAKLADVVPAAFGDWTSQDIGDPLAVNGPGTLSAKLYNELLTRAYVNSQTGMIVVALLAYGAHQTDELQLHRPEICYPAFGFALTRNEPMAVPLADGVTIPARELAAESEGRRESIIYWSRLGELLPQSSSGQRNARVETALHGIVADGLLSRFSVAGDYPRDDWNNLSKFARELVFAVKPDRRNVLIGTTRANQIAGDVATA